MAVFAPPIASADLIGTNPRGGECGGPPPSPSPSPPPPPILRHHRPDEFEFADLVLTKTVEDSELFPTSAARSDWFLPRRAGLDDEDDDDDDDDPSFRTSSAHVQDSRCGGDDDDDDGTASTRTSLSSSSPPPPSRLRRRATIHAVGPPLPLSPPPPAPVLRGSSVRRRASASDRSPAAAAAAAAAEADGCDNDGDDDANAVAKARRRRREASSGSSSNSPSRVPSVLESDVVCDGGAILGSGGFCEVRLACLGRTRTDVDGEEDSRKPPRLYAMKYLSPTKFAPNSYKAVVDRKASSDGRYERSLRNKSFERGIADLAVEARFLALISHENIIGLHYVGRGHLAGQFNCREEDDYDDDDDDFRRGGGGGHRFGFFLLLDPLFETLSARIERTYIPRAFDRPASTNDGGDEYVVPFPRNRMHLSFGLLPSTSNSWWGLATRRRATSRDDPRLDARRAELARRLGVIKCVASGLAYLHDDCRAVSRDVKPDNIGFYRRYRPVCRCGDRSAGREDGCSCYDEVPKLFDFGLCKELKPKLIKAHPNHGPDEVERTYKLTGRSGTRRYMAPEVALSQPYNDKVDVYSLGVTLYQVASLVAPYGGYSLVRHEMEVLRGGDRPSLEIPSSRRVASLLAKRGGGLTYERWLAVGDAKRKEDMLELRSKCVWTRELQSLIRDCWRGDMRMRPRMRDVVTRLDGCIQELTSIKRHVFDGLEGDKTRMTSRRLDKSMQPV